MLKKSNITQAFLLIALVGNFIVACSNSGGGGQAAAPSNLAVGGGAPVSAQDVYNLAKQLFIQYNYLEILRRESSPADEQSLQIEISDQAAFVANIIANTPEGYAEYQTNYVNISQLAGNLYSPQLLAQAAMVRTINEVLIHVSMSPLLVGLDDIGRFSPHFETFVILRQPARLYFTPTILQPLRARFQIFITNVDQITILKQRSYFAKVNVSEKFKTIRTAFVAKPHEASVRFETDEEKQVREKQVKEKQELTESEKQQKLADPKDKEKDRDNKPGNKIKRDAHVPHQKSDKNAGEHAAPSDNGADSNDRSN